MRVIKTATSNHVYGGDGRNVQDLHCRVANLQSADYQDGALITMAVWQPDEDERRRIAKGANIEVGILYANPIPPTVVSVTDEQELPTVAAEGDEALAAELDVVYRVVWIDAAGTPSFETVMSPGDAVEAILKREREEERRFPDDTFNLGTLQDKGDEVEIELWTDGQGATVHAYVERERRRS